MLGRAALGVRGEDAAAAWYRRASYEVIDRNWRCAEGELDVVAHSADGARPRVLRGEDPEPSMFGSPFEAVTPAKQRRVRRLAGAVAPQRAPRRGALRPHQVRRGRGDGRARRGPRGRGAPGRLLTPGRGALGPLRPGARGAGG